MISSIVFRRRFEKAPSLVVDLAEELGNCVEAVVIVLLGHPNETSFETEQLEQGREWGSPNGHWLLRRAAQVRPDR